MLTVVTGGSGSGKSAFAENLVLSSENQERIYLATMEVYDDESRAKVARHRYLRRNKGFKTLEIPLRLEETEVPEKSVVLLEDMSNLTANEMFSPEGRGEEGIRGILEGVRKISKTSWLIVVTNSVFSDGVVYEPSTEAYLENLAKINQEMSALAREVYEVVCGIPVKVKSEAAGTPDDFYKER